MRSTKRTLVYKTVVGLIFGFSLVFIGFRVADLVQNHKGYNINKTVNERNEAYAQSNPFGFTDRVRSPKKPKGVYRIAVLGDSFIWGDGMPYEKVWSHKLEKNLLNKYDSIEVMSWGLCGWSTLDEFNFYKEHGKDFDVDLLIIGWVDNDPDVGKIEQVRVSAPETAYPFLYKISPELAQWRANNANGDVYMNWMAKLYSLQNLKDYEVVLNHFHQYMEQQNTPLVIAMTPSMFCDFSKTNFNTIKPLLLKAGFNCLDLYGPAEKKLRHYSKSELQANPSNQHPGDLMTEEFASEVQTYLERNGYLKNLPKKANKN